MGFCFIFSYKKESWGNAGPTSGQTVPALVWRWSNSGPTYVAVWAMILSHWLEPRHQIQNNTEWICIRAINICLICQYLAQMLKTAIISLNGADFLCRKIGGGGGGADRCPVPWLLEGFDSVPQGTAIGPILFLIYINDIQSGISSRMRLFADDSVIYRTINSYSDHLALRDALTKLWASKRQMTFKPEKCYVMSITNKIGFKWSPIVSNFELLV